MRDQPKLQYVSRGDYFFVRNSLEPRLIYEEVKL